MSYNIIIFIILLFVVLIIDLPMVMLVFKPNLWNKTLQNIQGKSNNKNNIHIIIGFILCYILIPLGIFLFVLPKIDKKQWIKSCILWGFLYGIIVYGIFDFTNLVLFEDYTLKLSIIDTIWGGILTAISLLITYYIGIKTKLIK